MSSSRSWYIQPLDAGTILAIVDASQAVPGVKEVGALKDQQGMDHAVWECPRVLITMLHNSGVKSFLIFRRSGNGPLVPRDGSPLSGRKRGKGVRS